MSSRERRLKSEIDYHIERVTQDYIAAGMDSQNRAFRWHLRPAENASDRWPLQLGPDNRCGTVRVSEDYLARLLGSKFSCAWREHAHEHRHSCSCQLKLARRIEPYSERIEAEGV